MVANGLVPRTSGSGNMSLSQNMGTRQNAWLPFGFVFTLYILRRRACADPPRYQMTIATSGIHDAGRLGRLPLSESERSVAW